MPASILKRLMLGFRGRSLAVDGVWVIATQIVGKGTAILLTLALAHLLTVRDFTTLSYLFATAALLSAYMTAGLPHAILRVVAQGRDHRSWPNDDRMGAVLLVVAVTSIAAVGLAPFYLSWLLSNEVALSGPLLIAAGLAMTWSAVAQAGMYGSGQFRAAFPPMIAATLLLLTSTSVAVWVGSMTLLIVGNIVSILIPAGAYTWRLHRENVLVRRHWTRWPGREAIAEVLATTIPGLGVNIIYASMNWFLLRILVERQETPDQFNMYMMGLQWFTLVLFVPLALGQVLFPKFVQKTVNKSLTLSQVALPALLTFATLLVCAIIGTLLTPLISWVYGAQYQFTHAFVFAILLAAALSGAVNLLGSFVMAVRGLFVWMLVNVASAIVAGLLLWLLPVNTAFWAAAVLCLIQLTPLAISCVFLVLHEAGDHLPQQDREQVLPTGAAEAPSGQP